MIKAQHNLEIKEWENNETTFLETRGTRHIITSISSNDCIVVTGSSGCGKSSNIHHVALHLRDSFGYEIIPILTEPSEIISYNNENKKQVFVVDDICGKEMMNLQTLKNWKDKSVRFEKIFKTVENETTFNRMVSQITGSKLLISCRLHIYKEEQFQLVKLLTRKECNLLSPDMCLLPDERQLMLQKYLPHTWNAIIVSVLKIEKNVDFFPLLCKMSQNKTPEEVIKLFKASVDCIKQSIKHIILESNDQFCALVLCILFDGGFDTSWLNLKSAPEMRKEKLENIVKEFKIDLCIESSRNALISGFYTLDGTYLKQSFARYHMIHDKIKEMAAVICGQRRPLCFIRFSSSLSIRDHFIFKSVMKEQPRDDVIVLSKDTEEEYFERLLSDLKKLNITSTFYNKQITSQIFRNALISFFEKKDEAKKILKMIDIKEDRNDKIYITRLPYTRPLIESASCGYLDLVQFLVNTVKCNVNVLDEKNRSPVYKASKGGHTAVVKFLYENSASVTLCNMYDKSPLYVACKGGHTETVKYLLLKKANVSHSKTFGTCPLYVACKGLYVDIVKLLLQKNTDVLEHNTFGWSIMECVQGHTNELPLSHKKKGNVRQRVNRYFPESDQSRLSPLYVAYEGGSIEIFKVLLEKAKYDDFFMESYWQSACDRGHTDIVRLLLQRYGTERQSNKIKLRSTFSTACKEGLTTIEEKLLMRDVNVGDFDYFEEPLLCMASSKGHTSTVHLLLQYNADVSKCNNLGASPLHMACKGGHTKTAKLLLQNKADVSQWNNKLQSPLHVACSRGYTDTAELLLQNKADVSMCSDIGKSPLYVACEGGYKDTAELLLQNKADVSKCNDKGESPLFVACEGGYKDTAELLLQNKADVSKCNDQGESPLHVACAGGYKDTAELLLQNKADVSKCNDQGESPLHGACAGGYTDTAELLLQYKADVSKCSHRRRSPLYVACEGGYTETAELLLQNKADVSKCNNRGESPLYVACFEGYEDTAELLLQNQADVSQCDNRGESPLYVACSRGHVNTVKILLQNNASVSQCDQQQGWSPLHVVCDRYSLQYPIKYKTKSEYEKKYRDHVEIVKLFLTGNADFNLCDKKGQTPLDIARESEFFEIVKFLELSLSLKTPQMK